MSRGAVALLAALALLAGAPASSGAEAPAGTEAPPTDSAAPPKPAPPPAEAKPEEHKPQNFEPIEADAAVAILGKKVRDAAGKDMGLVVDVVVDRDGRVRAAVIDFGGFLGVGSRKIAIDWRLLQVNPANHDAPIVLALDRAEVQAAPEYKAAASGQPAMIVGPPPAEGGTIPRNGAAPPEKHD